MAMRIVSLQANMSYQYNQYYLDGELEKVWQSLLSYLPRENKRQATDSKRVLWYDAFGLGNRGLAYIYLQALDKLGYEILYITYDGVQSTLTRINEIVGMGRHKTIFLPHGDFISQYEALTRHIIAWGATYNFLYTTPHDVTGIGAFQNLPAGFRRYQVNLTDHAYWLGMDAFDICIEFRDFGAYISHALRQIPKKKLRKLPYYPTVDKEAKFQGFPFDRKNGSKVMFSGGSIYKTVDKESTFYQIVAELLTANPNLLFWYAGNKRVPAFKALEQKFPGRVTFTAERSDLYQVLEKVDVYLNTYPVSGALMLQYAALAGKVPFTLIHDDDAYGILLSDDGVYYLSRDEMVRSINRYINDEEYRRDLDMPMKEAVITPDKFQDNLQKLLTEDYTDYGIKYQAVDVASFQKVYKENWQRGDCYRMIVAQKNIWLYRHYLPEIFIWTWLTLQDGISKLGKNFIGKHKI
ncbi:glycosyltransferase family 4 protein [Selenomonas caprae]|uniref:Glycosyltransferase family 4 protein n=1 Tax=Selenomonas caprae TaxID=2606905 RepID=A0A5D6WKY3_9FIRM|nr:glycosyltransferase family 4 protein [Selenomonas caprae]TYZ27785.1 glycosyltransferase family 4 protein [Selenomonas caprae]